MNCSDFPATWVEAHAGNPLQGPAGKAASRLEGHAAHCTVCAAHSRRMSIVVGLLGTLEHDTAPRALDALVDAQIGADCSKRAARAMGMLDVVQAPDELTLRVAGDLEAANQAPGILDQMVDERLRDLPQGIAEGMLGRVEAIRAPSVLDERVDEHVRKQAQQKAGGSLAGGAGASLGDQGAKDSSPSSRVHLRLSRAVLLAGSFCALLSIAWFSRRAQGSVQDLAQDSIQAENGAPLVERSFKVAFYEDKGAFDINSMPQKNGSGDVHAGPLLKKRGI